MEVLLLVDSKVHAVRVYLTHFRAWSQLEKSSSVLYLIIFYYLESYIVCIRNA